jgi:maleylpyruvate isomerase
VTAQDPGADAARALDRDVAGAAAAHQGLLTMLDEALAEGRLDVAAPSRLPDWTVGHVLTHVARNADSIVRVLEGSGRGEIVERYVGGRSARNAGIEAGAARPAAEQVDDVRRTIWRLEQTWAGDVNWDGQSLEATGRLLAVRELPHQRRREVEVHRVDLGLGYEPADWPAEYVRLELRELEMRWAARRPMGLTGLPPEALALAPYERLAWLLGRQDVDGLEPAGVM